MFTFKFLFFLILSINVIQKIITQSNSKDIGKCNCDLSLGHCDLNCCCDNDCSKIDFEIFKCSQKSNFTTKQWCIPNSALFLSNTPYIITTLGDLVCVDINNTLSLNYYLSPLTDSIGISDSFISVVANLIAPQNVKSAFDLPTSESPFNITNYVYSILPTNQINVLNLPMQVGSNCRAGPPVYHYQDRTTNCLASPKALIDECNKVTTSALSLKYFLNDPKFIRKPRSLQNCFESTNSASNPFDYYTRCSSDYIIDLKIRSCSDEEGSQINQCETKLEPTLDIDKCTNLIKSVSYLFRFDSSTGILEAGLDVVFQNEININTNTKFVEQTFKTFFIPKSIKLSEFDSFKNQRLSGNPGYLRGKPILVGASGLSTGSLTYFVPNSQGKCVFSDDSSRTNVKFQENAVSECLFEPPFDKSSSDYCKNLQDTIEKIILGIDKSKRAARFAPFATSDPKDWVQITNAVSNQPQVTNLNNVCKSVRIGTSIIIAFALVGNVANPQPQIQYISYNWDEMTDIRIDSNQIKVSSRVIFIDVSQPPLYSESKMARPQANLPGDFFYPIINSSYQVKISKCFLFFFVFIVLL